MKMRHTDTWLISDVSVYWVATHWWLRGLMPKNIACERILIDCRIVKQAIADQGSLTLRLYIAYPGHFDPYTMPINVDRSRVCIMPVVVTLAAGLPAAALAAQRLDL